MDVDFSCQQDMIIAASVNMGHCLISEGIQCNASISRDKRLQSSEKYLKAAQHYEKSVTRYNKIMRSNSSNSSIDMIENSQLLTFLAHAHFLSKKYQVCLSVLKRAIVSNQKDLRSWYNYYQTLYQQSKYFITSVKNTIQEEKNESLLGSG